jgi:hypothetical protein
MKTWRLKMVRSFTTIIFVFVTDDLVAKELLSGRSERLSSIQTCSSRIVRDCPIILDGDKRDHLDAESESSEVERRFLDAVPWAVVRYNVAAGECLLVRGAQPTGSTDEDDPEIDGFEGEQRRFYILHRRREASIRQKKTPYTTTREF